ncbi:MAG TPA: hypothetical protein VGS08_03355 [Candidatus Saccharimonadales bacterium]|nr:hypothetical protein [Candidatus Saccharimonadales bacterium]
MSELENRTYGVELEKPFMAETGDSYGVGPEYFGQLQALKEQRGEPVELKYIGDQLVAISTQHGEEALDNGFNLGESATGPINQADGGLCKLYDVTRQELSDIAEALEPQHAAVLNMSNHPLVNPDDAAYSRFVVPKPAYSYVRTVRGWNHKAGINASAQNSPSTGIAAYEAANAVNIMIGLGAGMIALYANSPFENSRLTNAVESRMGLWEKMFSRAAKIGDRRLHHDPEAPFESLREYFSWMFGPGTTMFFASQENTTDAKHGSEIVAIDGDPSLLEFLESKERQGHLLESSEVVHVQPKLGDLALHQFLQFSGARVRFGFIDGTESTEEFMAAMRGRGTEVEDFMSRKTSFMYIEGRDAGANFADEELLDTVGESDIVRSVVISSSALQAGLLGNASEARRLVDSYDWSTLMALRHEAAKKGLDGSIGDVQVNRLCQGMLQVAADGLRTQEKWMLEYPQFVLETGKSGAKRALAMYDKRPELTEKERIRATILRRKAVLRDTIA